ncbi:hypothetical protein B0T25DRAFT_493051 [Lasiosphaeria hispida]|uniref:Uncharacterized protein n=1 Tax=Lasiosphaeria hispida TaxID=260671 RepID=A0AAJ0HWL8_9PEZI|nr:hypothetical protein B0T25DRAFT_493051 [Lasiosphaeria hispida]
MASPDKMISVSASTSAASPALTNHSTAPSLGEKTTTIRFVNTKAFWDLINSTDQETLEFYNVSSQDFIRLEQERELRRRGIRFRRYKAEERILIILIPGMPHEQLHLKLYHEARDEIVFMGLRDAWTDCGATTFPGRPGGSSGEGDSSGCPDPQPDGRSWPTLVIEAGDSSSLQKLWQDMRWWFSASDHQVQIVLLAKLDRPGRRIILEKWVETTPPPCPGPITRAAALRQPNCVQNIVIDWTNGTAAEIPASHIVTRGDLRLEFQLLFSRPPINPGEGDILITTPRLQVWASKVWRAVFEL